MLVCQHMCVVYLFRSWIFGYHSYSFNSVLFTSHLSCLATSQSFHEVIHSAAAAAVQLKMFYNIYYEDAVSAPFGTVSPISAMQINAHFAQINLVFNFLDFGHF